MQDKLIENLIKKETKRQSDTINLIASENYVSKDVLQALGSVFTNKYAEGYPGKRYYGGNEFVDQVENLARERALGLFKLSSEDWSVNVQPYSGSPANLAVYLALVPAGDPASAAPSAEVATGVKQGYGGRGKIMGMRLDMGGHLTHGHKVSATGKLWQQVPFGVNQKTEQLDYDEIRQLAEREKPKLIVAGFTAYSRIIDFKKFREIADAVSAILMVDMSHFAGLVAGGVYPSPFLYADVVTTTTHKTLRGPRGAVIFTRSNVKCHMSPKQNKFATGQADVSIASAIDKAVFPGLQGGPHVNQIAAAAVALAEAARSDFKKYAKQIVKNAKILALSLSKSGWRIVSGGTDSHLFLVDTWQKGISGKEAENRLENIGIIVNKNAIPYDTRKPMDPSGIRIGTPSVTTRGMKEKEMKIVAKLIDQALTGTSTHDINNVVRKLCNKFSLP